MLKESGLYKYRDRVMYNMFSKTNNHIEVQLSEKSFSEKTNNGFMYVLHYYHYGFVPYYQNKDTTMNNQPIVNNKFISVYQVEVEYWRKKLKVDNGQK